MHESGQLPNLAFSDEKAFQIEQFVNKESDRVYLPKRSAEYLPMRLAIKTYAPPKVMVCADVTADGHSPLVFINRGVKIIAEIYRQKYSIEVMGRQTFWPQIMDIPTDPRTTALSTPQPRTAYKGGSSLHFSPHNGHQSPQSQSVRLLRLGHFG